MTVHSITVDIKVLPHGASLPLPSYATPQAAGMDLMAALGEGKTMILPAGDMRKVPTGISIALPQGTEAQIRPRSGLAFAHGITLLNSPGTIDSDYRGEISVLLINHGKQPFTIDHGMRIAQMVIAPVLKTSWHQTTKLDKTARFEGGFGSTGLRQA